MLDHGWSLQVLRAWQTVSAGNHLSQQELRRTYKERETISAIREDIQRKLRYPWVRRTAAVELAAELDRWTMIAGVGKLCSGEMFNRDQVLRGMSSMVSL